MSAHSSRVNLLPPSEFEMSFWGKFLRWAVTTARYMIILTEMVVIVVFLMRFKLDEDNRNLNEQIGGQVNYLQSRDDQEAKFRKLQKKLLFAGKLFRLSTTPTKSFAYMSERIPVELLVKNRKVTPKDVSISATTLSEKAMGWLMATVSADPAWKDVTVTQLKADKTEGIKFTLTASR